MNTARFLRRTLDGEEIVVDLEREQFYALNETAARIVTLWREGVRDVASLAARLAAEFDVDERRAGEEIVPVLEEARRLDLLGD